MKKNEQIEELFKQANQEFAGLKLAPAKIKSKLWEEIDIVTEEKNLWLNNISREFLKLKLYRYSIIVLASFVILLLAGSGIGYAADLAVPGDVLYPLDRKIEGIQLLIFRNPETNSQLRILILEERTSELEKLKNKGNQSDKIEKLKQDSLGDLERSFPQALKVMEIQRLNYELENQFVPRKIQIMENHLERLERVNQLIKAERLNARKINLFNIYLIN
jgi:hypothetical protein